MPFEKGNTVNLGRKDSPETRLKKSLAHKGSKPSEWGAGFKPGNIPWNKRESVKRNAYFAGLVDGEGSIFITNNTNKDGAYKKICVAIAMRADKAQPLPIGQKIWGGNIHLRGQRRSNQNEVLDWRLWTKSAEKFLRDIRPYLLIKQKQADLALEYRHLQTRKRKSPGILTNAISEKEWLFRKELEDKMTELNK